MRLNRLLSFCAFYVVTVYCSSEEETEPAVNPRLVCENIETNNRFDCFPGEGANEEECLARGCCWMAQSYKKDSFQWTDGKQIPPVDVPSCFFPSDYVSYTVTNVSESTLGITAFFELQTASPYPRDVSTLRMDVLFETEDRLRVRIFDPVEKRFEPPYPIVPSVTIPANETKYVFELDSAKIGFQVIRKSDNTIIFNSQNVGGFIFSDQLLQLSALIPTRDIYGLGEHRDTLRLHSNWKRFTFWNHDTSPNEDTNVYGSHALYLMMEESGNSHGVFLLNSNAMEIILQPAPAITYRTIGGIFDFYFFLGPSPSDVVRQYTDVVGRPTMPPYWSLGFHMCKFKYGSLEVSKEVWTRNREAEIPFDVQWTDSDYMYHDNCFTLNDETYGGLPQFINEIHASGMRWIPIVDTGISGGEPPGSYPPYDDALEMDLLIRNIDGEVLLGLVWNDNSTAYPDYTHPRATEYYTKQLSEMHSQLPFDGIWIDMNEPSNVFFNGSIDGCPDNELENPPYLIGVDGGLLTHKTLCMSSQQYIGTHYNAHNLHGITHAVATYEALASITRKRPFIISRSTFAGQGRYSGHWSGDNTSNWYDLKKSIAEILSFNLFGVPMVGVDICGFYGNTTVPLCQRWQELGAFYPFSRNHNQGAMHQDPAFLGPEVVNATIKANTVRYSLLPFLYTLFWQAHVNGSTVARPLFFEFPLDRQTYDMETQFLWGSGLMIAPVMDEAVTERSVYFPVGRWYDFYTHELVTSTSSGISVRVQAPLDTIPLFLRGGNILPMQVPSTTTAESRFNPFELLVALDDNGQANGYLYWDDGEAFVDPQTGIYNAVRFSAKENALVFNVENLTYTFWMPVTKITVLGVQTHITSVLIFDEEMPFNHTGQVLTIGPLETVSLTSQGETISWS